MPAMGKQNQQRRAAKQRRREQVSARRRPGSGRVTGARPAGGEAGEPPLDDLVWALIDLVRSGTDPRAACERLALKGPASVAAASKLLRRALEELGRRGWSPADVDHVITRQLSPAHARAAAGESPRPAVAEALQLVVEVLLLVVSLPEVPVVGAAGDATGAEAEGLDPRIVKRVRALLNKAESTEFPEEAEALTAKAQELIARHALDAVRVRIGGDVGVPSSRRMYLDDPYVDPKALLLDRVAQANRCTAVYTPAFAWSTTFGYDADLDAVELLTASLLAQAAHALARQGSRVDASGRSRTKSFRRAFLVGFANRIGERLQEATAAQVSAADDGDGRLLPVLLARDERVEAAQAEAYPRVVSRRTGASNGAGWAAGRAAAELADLSTGSGALEGGRG